MIDERMNGYLRAYACMYVMHLIAQDAKTYWHLHSSDKWQLRETGFLRDGCFIDVGDGVIPLNKLEVPIGTLSVYTNSVVNYPPIPPEAPTRRSVASEMAFVNFCVLPIFRSLQIVSTQSRIHRVFNDCLPLGASARQGYSHVLSKRDRLEEWRYMCTCFLLADEVKWIR